MVRLIVIMLTLVFSAVTHAGDADINKIYATWCLNGLSQKIDGPKTPDKSNYTFTKNKKLKYDAGFFKQEDNFTIEGNKIRTKTMGNYQLISINSTEMVLYYGAYMFFSKGRCR